MIDFYPQGVCSKKITFAIEDGKLRDIQFYRGCDGNLKSLSRLVEGMSAVEAMEKLRGIQCGTRGTSCADQFARAISEALEADPARAPR